MLRVRSLFAFLLPLLLLPPLSVQGPPGLLFAQGFPRRDAARLQRTLYEFRLDANANAAWWWTKDSAAAPALALVRSDGFVFDAEQEVAAFFGGSWMGAPGWQTGPIVPGQSPPAVYHSGRFTAEEWDALTAAERDALRADMRSWPVSLGAPWKDADGNGRYEPDTTAFPALPGDAPLPIGDEALWTVTHDGGEFAARQWDQQEAGLEFRHLVWAMAGTGCPERVVIQRLRVVNRAAGLIKEMRLGLYADIALGDTSDDLAGYDSTLGLAYAWNAGDKDALLGDPPAIGYLLLQGVAEPAEREQGLFDFALREGIRNQPPAAFTFFTRDSSYQQVPEAASNAMPAALRSALRGLRADGDPQRDPSSGGETHFAAAGSPVRGTGWVDGVFHPAGGRVLLLSFGPFMLARGDTQEVVFARIGAQGGGDSRADVQALIDYALCVRQHYAAQFTTAAEAPPPLSDGFTIDAFRPHPLPRGARTANVDVRSDRPGTLRIVWRDILGRVLAESHRDVEAGASTLALAPPPPNGAGVLLLELHTLSRKGARLVVMREE